MSALTDFLTARLDEDEAAAKAVAPLGHVFDMGGNRLDERFSHTRLRFASEDGRAWTESDAAAARHFALHDPARVLREVDAKRKILAEYQRLDAEISDLVVRGRQPGHHMDAMRALHVAVCAFAAVWSDHPDYVKLKKES